MLRIRLHVSEQQFEIFENLEPQEKLTFNEKMNRVIFPHHQSLGFIDKSALLEKIISIDPKSIDAKQEVIQNVSNLLESAKSLEISFDKFFSNKQRQNDN